MVVAQISPGQITELQSAPRAGQAFQSKTEERVHSNIGPAELWGLMGWGVNWVSRQKQDASTMNMRVELRSQRKEHTEPIQRGIDREWMVAAHGQGRASGGSHGCPWCGLAPGILLMEPTRPDQTERAPSSFL